MKLQVTLELDLDEELWNLDDLDELAWFVSEVLPNLKLYWEGEDFLSEDTAKLISYRLEEP